MPLVCLHFLLHLLQLNEMRWFRLYMWYRTCWFLCSLIVFRKLQSCKFKGRCYFIFHLLKLVCFCFGARVSSNLLFIQMIFSWFIVLFSVLVLHRSSFTAEKLDQILHFYFRGYKGLCLHAKVILLELCDAFIFVYVLWCGRFCMNITQLATFATSCFYRIDCSSFSLRNPRNISEWLFLYWLLIYIYIYILS